MAEHAGAVTFKGNPMTLTGEGEAVVGQLAPDALLSKSLVEDCKISDLRGKKVIINVVPSLDTGVCSTQTARFNKEAASLGDDVVILTVSRDLPVAMSRWCEANKAEHIVATSDYKHRDFGAKYGLVVKELGLLARAVFVVDTAGKIAYKELVKEIAEEPNYEAALDAVKKL